MLQKVQVLTDIGTESGRGAGRNCDLQPSAALLTKVTPTPARAAYSNYPCSCKHPSVQLPPKCNKMAVRNYLVWATATTAKCNRNSRHFGWSCTYWALYWRNFQGSRGARTPRISMPKELRRSWHGPLRATPPLTATKVRARISCTNRDNYYTQAYGSTRQVSIRLPFPQRSSRFET